MKGLFQSHVDRFESGCSRKFLPELSGQPVCLPEGLGNSVAADAAFHELSRAFKVRKVAGRDVNGLNTVARAEHIADDIASKIKRNIIAPAEVQSFMSTDKALLCTADRGDVQTESDVARQSELAGVGDSLAVAKEDVRWAFELPEGIEQWRGFPEREETRDIGEGDSRDDVRAFKHVKGWPSEGQHNGYELVQRLHVANVGGADHMDMVRERLQSNITGKLPLKSDCLPGE